ncbi:unnamed protein product [Clonostachys rosea f. rosea IK726]|jgi:hypothetical protein|uniref:DUF7492 domain-containing protein n=2 Tax=Bionectria ochroleuca TaxID=29856 RepID=A0A0B7KRV6_BIOOC|nr:unnamed protein product [Clonostachys rosea f. rosea IK726]
MPTHALYGLLCIASLALVHYWVERLMRINLEGTFPGDRGYIRGAVSRYSPSFTDSQMLHLLDSGLMCKETQRTRNYSADFPPLVASPGSFIALQYQENGHVTLPWLSPHKPTPGQVFVCGTSEPYVGDLFRSIHRVWDREGGGGDARGRLLAQWAFDDGQCYQRNEGTESLFRQNTYAKVPSPPQDGDLWCQIDIRLPAGLHEQYTLYWVWEWPAAPTSEYPAGQPEIYTSCMDVLIGDGGLETGNVDYTGGQDLNFAGIPKQLGTLGL